MKFRSLIAGKQNSKWQGGEKGTKSRKKNLIMTETLQGCKSKGLARRAARTCKQSLTDKEHKMKMYNPP